MVRASYQALDPLEAIFIHALLRIVDKNVK